MVLHEVLELAPNDTQNVLRLAAALVDVGLAEHMGYGHLKLDPALPSYMLREMDEAQIEASRTRWAESMQRLAGFLYGELFKDAKLVTSLTELELPNLMAVLVWLQDHSAPETVIDLADTIERLTSRLGRKSALVQAIKVREKAALKLGVWSHAAYLNQSATIDRLLEQGDLPFAHAVAQTLLRRSTETGVAAYPEAEYDVAMAYAKLGRVLNIMRAAEAALKALAEAQRRFENLAKNGNINAEGMYGATMTEAADCLRDLGRLDEAASIYQEAITRDEKGGRERDVAVDKAQLASIRIMQGRYDEALTAYKEALKIFENLGEPVSVATIWHQIGMVYRQTMRFSLAEEAYRQSLAIEVSSKNSTGEATSLGELGNLYAAWGRLEEAAAFNRLAADAFHTQQNLSSEGQARNNLAHILIMLRRYDEARPEVLRAIECLAPFGHAGQLWKTWSILNSLEAAVGKHSAADAARQEAIESYLAYRRTGGVSQNTSSDLFAFTADALQKNQVEAALQFLAQLSADDIPQGAKLVIPKLQAILQGDRSSNLIDDPNLSYTTVAELQLLIEQNPSPNTSS
jgi:tetratricopeptide (TPR) repeat protein